MKQFEADLSMKGETYDVDAVTLVAMSETHGDMELRLCLYRLTLDGARYFAVTSSDGNEHAAEILCGDPDEAELLYRRLVHGCVPPCTLGEIVSDLLLERKYCGKS